MSNELALLFNKYSCDKTRKHQYHTVYGPEFESMKDKPLNILEVGVFKGASTAAWLEYFPNATLYAIDIFTRVDPSDIDVLKDARVKWLKGSSTDSSITAAVKEQWPDVKFDIIIDDGLHTPRANADTFTNLYPLLKRGGSYYIEDVWALEQFTLKEMQHQWIKSHPSDLNIFENDYFLAKLSGKKVDRFDLRGMTGQLDSYIIKITK